MAPPPTCPKPLLEAKIVWIVRTLARTHGRVFPWMVQERLLLEFYRAEQTLRRDMQRLVDKGVLERIGQRKGYKPAPVVKVFKGPILKPVQLPLPLEVAA